MQTGCGFCARPGSNSENQYWFRPFPVVNKEISDCLSNNIIEEALKINWTRDVFDRLLVAETMRDQSLLLITASQKIREKFAQALCQLMVFIPQRCNTGVYWVGNRSRAGADARQTTVHSQNTQYIIILWAVWGGGTARTDILSSAKLRQVNTKIPSNNQPQDIDSLHLI